MAKRNKNKVKQRCFYCFVNQWDFIDLQIFE